MNRSILVACACAAALAGCGRTIVREERVVEQPVPAPSATVVAPSAAVVAPPAVALSAPLACSLGNNVYAAGTLSCQGTYEYRCNNGVWERIEGSSC